MPMKAFEAKAETEIVRSLGVGKASIVLLLRTMPRRGAHAQDSEAERRDVWAFLFGLCQRLFALGAVGVALQGE